MASDKLYKLAFEFKKLKLWKVLNERIRIPWNKNATYQIIFK